MWSEVLQSEFMAKDQCANEMDLPAVMPIKLKINVGFYLKISFSHMIWITSN